MVSTEYSFTSQCLKITEKVALNIASEASYVYIVSGQKFFENAKKTNLASFILLSQCLKITEKVTCKITSEASYAQCHL